MTSHRGYTKPIRTPELASTPDYGPGAPAPVEALGTLGRRRAGRDRRRLRDLRPRGRAGAANYVTQEITRGDITVTVTATGNLEPRNQVEIGSELSGTCARSMSM